MSVFSETAVMVNRTEIMSVCTNLEDSKFEVFVVWYHFCFKISIICAIIYQIVVSSPQKEYLLNFWVMGALFINLHQNRTEHSGVCINCDV